MLKKFALAAAVTLALGGCGGSDGSGAQGPEGPQGPAGPAGPTGATGATGGGYYTSRANVYCNVTPIPNSSLGVTVRCNTAKDLPVSGGCSDGGGDQRVALTANIPVDWDATAAAAGSAAGWGCMWSANGMNGITDGTNVVVAGGSARICCVTVP